MLNTCLFWKAVYELAAITSTVSFSESVLGSRQLHFAGFGEVYPVMITKGDSFDFLVVSHNSSKEKVDMHPRQKFDYIFLLREPHPWEIAAFLQKASPNLSPSNIHTVEILPPESKYHGVTTLISQGAVNFTCIV